MKEYFVEQTVDAIKHAKEQYPNESCGAIIDGKYTPFQNLAEDKSDTFLIKDTDFTTAYIQNRVEAVIHSHNDYERASKQDQIQQLELEVPFGIINLVNKSVKHVVFWGDDLEIQDFHLRPFFYGVYDCYSLVRDWYKINRDTVLPFAPRNFAFWYRDENVFEQYIENTDYFEYVELSDIKAGDVLLYNFYETPYINHSAILLENNLVLHHLYNLVSTEYPLSYCQQYLKKAMRLQ